MKLSLYTLGCKQNYAETSHIREQFEKHGHTIVEFGEPCDIVLVNTCTVTENADTECRKIIRRALKTSPDAFVGVTGCYAQLQPEEIASIDGVDAVFGAKEKFNIPNLISDFTKRGTPALYVAETDDMEFVPAVFSENDSRSRAFLKMQDGCDYNCSFCTIPMARGGSRSMNFNDIERNIRRLEQAGFHEIILTGINLGEYLARTGERFIDVLQAIEAMQPAARIRLGSVEPNKVTQDIVDIISQSPVFCPHFHIPLQSGSPDILRKMRRRYKADYYADLVARIKRAHPDACIGADVITGFPGESDAHFEETYSFINALDISYLHVFTYSERDNTPASVYDGKVDVYERRVRTNRLRSLSEIKKNTFYDTQQGKTRTVIPEQYHSETATWSGYTENYVRAHISGAPALVQQPIRVQLVQRHGDIVRAEALDSMLSTKPATYIPILV
ncbi:MAG: tRNA (N(6)-L-threonylcarbamoyladenosine(37)-C(2))-methylthiotransferase MtaB [Candidatus Kapabacteria bacterium]|nr:tRNA (N(6)-L-threonylcarbamoyladenosine(37)-C(2))-methylthiotransferase MtaB [Candidatus Kapabacteria bacterium]